MTKKNKGKHVPIKIKKDKKTPPAEQTTPSVWNPFEVMENMGRFFMDDPWRPLWWRRWLSSDPWYHEGMSPEVKPATMDMINLGDTFKIIAELPGVQKKDLEVNITANKISICGEAKTDIEEEHEGYVRRERSYSTLCRNIVFPEEVNPDKAEAMLKDGILEILVWKKTPTKGRNIPIK